LLSQKSADFKLFTQVVELMNNKAHLSLEGIYQIINIKASMNLGLSDFFKKMNLVKIFRLKDQLF
jgi:hypothetical protein